MRQKPLVRAIATILLGAAPIIFDDARAQGADDVIAGQIARACGGEAGAFDPQGVFHMDLTGDGQADLLLNHAYVDCDGARPATCETGACAVSIFVHRDGGLRLSGEWDSVGVHVVPQSPPVVLLTAPDFTDYLVTWNGEGFELLERDQFSDPDEEQDGG